MPMTSPRMLTRGPPELPRLMAASVWMKRRKLAPGSVCRSLVEMMPAVNLCSRPNGEPPASTPSPTRPASGGPRGTAGQLAARVHLDDGDVGLLVGADDRAAQLLARLELDHDARHALDDVVVGEDDPLRVDDEAAPDPARGAAGAAAQHVEERVVAVVVVLAVVVLFGDLRRGDGVDVDDRRLDAAGGLGGRRG